MTAANPAPNPPARRCLAGVDEAGLGPILGPLVVAGVAMEGPQGIDPWRALGDLLCRHRQEKRKIRVADSKKVNQGKRGAERLERAALTFWAARHDDLPDSLGDWLHAMGVDLAPLRMCPWYCGDDGIPGVEDLPLPHFGDRDGILLQGAMLQRAMERSGLRLLDQCARPVDVDEFNLLIAATDNKSHAHFTAYGAVIARLLRQLPDGGHLVADRAGGRSRYRTALERHCPGHRVDIVSERSEESVYRLVRPDGAALRLTFASQGEDRAFPTALASCTAKYLRELMLHVLNSWFGGRIPGLAPTAGYYVDGHRFLADIEPHIDRLQIPYARLVRVR